MSPQARRSMYALAGFAFVVIVVLGIVLTFAIGNFTEATERQAKATEDLTAITEQVNANVLASNRAIAIGRYERVQFQIDQRELVCLDLSDGDAGPTTVQRAECAKDYIKLPPKPEGYDE